MDITWILCLQLNSQDIQVWTLPMQQLINQISADDQVGYSKRFGLLAHVPLNQ